MLRRSVSLVIACVVVGLFAGGCGSGKRLYKISGTVKFEDGTIPKAQTCEVTFQPVLNEPGVKGASGKIDANGNFKLTTNNPEDGVYGGEYNVTFKIGDGYPNVVSSVAADYESPKTTPYKNVKVPGDKFDFVVKKP